MSVVKLSEVRKICEDPKVREKYGIEDELCRVALSDLVYHSFHFVEYRRLRMDIGIYRELTLYTLSVSIPYHVLEELRKLFPGWNINVMYNEHPISVRIGGEERKIPVMLKVVLTLLEENKK